MRPFISCLACSFQLVPTLEKSRGLSTLKLKPQNEGQFNLIFDSSFVYGKESTFHSRVRDVLSLVILEIPTQQLLEIITSRINELVRDGIFFGSVIPIVNLDEHTKSPGYLREPHWALITKDPYFEQYKQELTKRAKS